MSSIRSRQTERWHIRVKIVLSTKRAKLKVRHTAAPSTNNIYSIARNNSMISELLGLWTLSIVGVIKATKRNIAATGSVSVSRGESYTYSVVYLRKR
jgi:hypothetical protein